MYSEFNTAISDPYVETYVESEQNLNAIKAAYPNTLTDFSTTSNVLQERLSYYLPYLVHLKFDVPTQKKAKKLLENFNDTKKSFEQMLEETKTDSLKGEGKNQYLYYGAFLPQYQKYIQAKYDVVKFIEQFFAGIGFDFGQYFNNLTKLTNLYIELSINIDLPSIYASIGNQNTLTPFISGSNNVTLNYLGNKFNEFKTTFKNNVNEIATQKFNSKFEEIKITFNTAINLYNGLNIEQQNTFLTASKLTKPDSINPSSDKYYLEILISYFATTNGKFFEDVNNLSITNYFNI